MNPFPMPVTCDVCGGDGVGSMETAAAQWKWGRHRYSEVRHANPSVCAANLERRARRLQQREDALAEAEASWL